MPVLAIAGALTTMSLACNRSPEPAAAPPSAAPAATPPAASPARAPAPADAAASAPAESEATEAPSDELIARVMAPLTGDLDDLAKRGYVRMLVTFSRTHYYLDKAQQRGLAHDAGLDFERFLNQRLKLTNPQLHVVFIPVSRDRLFHELAAGRGDVAAAGLTITGSRGQQADFSPPTLSGVREVVVTAADQPPVQQAEDLSGRTVHVRRSSSYHESLTALNGRLKAAGKPPVTIVDAPEALEDEDLLEMVNAGLMPATICDDYLSEFWGKVFEDIRIQPASVRADGELAWAIRKNTPQLHAAVADFVRANQKGSRNFNILYQKYLKNTEHVKNSARESEMRKLRQIRGLFEKYGDQYDLPWLLLAAQGYQESQLDQARRSHVGAVGVMQIKPSTAEGPPIFIKGVDRSVDRNIQAGVKYLRFIVDQYFADEPMDRLNKGLFAMASYNAGPARIARLRKQAQTIGLDPNRWFGQVEVVAARDIGRETVTYVSNIYKYYLAYNLVMQQREEKARARGR